MKQHKEDTKEYLSQNNTVSALKQAGQLVRHSQSPHVPIWVDGMNYPAQYLIRQTRSMTARLAALNNLVVSIPRHLISLEKPILPKLSKSAVKTLDFFLPDNDVFLHLKLQKLKDIQHERNFADQRSKAMVRKNVSNVLTDIDQDHTVAYRNRSTPIQRAVFDECGCLHWKDPSTLQISLECECSQHIVKGYIPLNGNELCYYTADSTHLLVALMGSLYLYETNADAVRLVATIPSVPTEKIKCIEIHTNKVSTVAVVGGNILFQLWIVEYEALYQVEVFKEKFTDLESLCVWTTDNRIDSDFTVACSFKLPCPVICYVKILRENTSRNYVVTEENQTLIEDIASCLCKVEDGNYLSGIINNKLYIWNFPSLTLLKSASLTCSPHYSVSTKILKAFAQVTSKYIFMIVSLTPPTSLPITSCCWLIMVSMVTYPYMRHDLNEVYKVHSYMLPTNVITDAKHNIQCNMIAAAEGIITAGLSNNSIVIWNPQQPNYVDYITLDIEVNKILLISKERMWLSSSNKLILLQREEF